MALAAATWAEAVGRLWRLALGLPAWRGAAWRVAVRRGVRGEVLQCGPRQGRDAAARVRGCNLRALGAPSAHTPDARRNAMALQSAWLELGFSRVGL